MPLPELIAPKTIVINSNTLFHSRVNTLALTEEGLKILDQTLIPHEIQYVLARSADEVIHAIRTMIVRGAPAIGIAGAYGLVLAAREWIKRYPGIGDSPGLFIFLKEQGNAIKAARPTAVNLGWAVDRLFSTLASHRIPSPEITPAFILRLLTEEAHRIYQEDIAGNQAIGRFGKSLVPKGARILTHCNAGALATGGYGTALGVVRAAFAEDPTVHVYADETRPRLQGARLTTWELREDGIPVTLIADSMSGSLMKQGKIDLVVVGADRIAANGDTANKIGTYNLAIIAKAHGVPFYVAAPLSTLDMSLKSGDAIPIEERSPEEIHTLNGEPICPLDIGFYNPAFDVTPADYITAIITEKGIATPDYRESLPKLFLEYVKS